jgi:hypothetical protein
VRVAWSPAGDALMFVRHLQSGAAYVRLDRGELVEVSPREVSSVDW